MPAYLGFDMTEEEIRHYFGYAVLWGLFVVFLNYYYRVF